MKIKNVIIDNFRNIKHADYQLKDMNIFAGPNGTGKSNTLLAIYWLLNDYLLDGSSDDASNKPFKRDKKTKTSVYLEFEDGWNIKKEYWENWVKKRGTAEIIMEGNMTQYYIRGDKVNVKEARKQLQERLGLNITTSTSAFNLSLALTDPNYIGSKVDATVLRSFVIELVGDVSNEDVFMTDPLFETVAPMIREYDGDASLVIKALKKKIKSCKDEIVSKEGAIDVLLETTDVSSEEINIAREKIYDIEDQIAIYRNKKVSTINLVVEGIEKEISDKKLKLSESIKEDNFYIVDKNTETNKQIEKCRDLYKTRKAEWESLNNEYFVMESQLRNFNDELKRMQKILSEKEQQLTEGRIQYGEIMKSSYHNTITVPEEVKCPHCGFVLNVEELDKMKVAIESSKQAFELEKNKKLESNIKTGKQLKLEIEDLKFKIEEQNKTISMYDLEVFRTTKLKPKYDEMKEVEDKGKDLTKTLITSYQSEKTIMLHNDLLRLEEKLQIEKKSDYTKQEIENKIMKCMEDRKPYDDIIAKHEVFNQTQNEIKRIQNDINVLSTKQTQYEQSLSTVSDFVKTKLSMLKKNVEKVFGTRVRFTLVKSNIKEGSWEEVCYPSVLDKETPFIRGSESERIRTGIYLIECIKHRLNIQDVPIIFDRSNDLDSSNLNNLDTKAQIITTRVDDIHYDDVTLVHQ